MLLNHLKVRAYRNLVDADLGWHEQFNVLHGCNAQGKTNLLEAIYLFGHLKSFRGARSIELLRHGAEAARLKADVNRGPARHQLEIRLHGNGRTPRVDGKTVQKLSDFIGHLRLVLFSPEELAVVKGYPAGRRALLDRAILQTEPGYLDKCQGYERILRQRNQLLKDQASERELAPWTEFLIKAGAEIREVRQSYISRFQPHLVSIYREISGDRERANILYSVADASRERLTESLAQELRSLASRERKTGQTLAGPQRDDIDFMLDDMSLRQYGSQGQQRSFLLAFKAAQMIDLEEEMKEPPILLLDDLASELDSVRQAGFFEFLRRRSGQVFLTTASLPAVADIVKNTANFYKVDHGGVTLTSP